MDRSRIALVGSAIGLLLLCVGCAKVERPAPSTPARTIDPTAGWQGKLNAARRAERNGDFRAAEKAYREAVSEAEKHWPNDPRLANSLNHLGEFYYGLEKLDDAEPVFR